MKMKGVVLWTVIVTILEVGVYLGVLRSGGSQKEAVLAAALLAILVALADFGVRVFVSLFPPRAVRVAAAVPFAAFAALIAVCAATFGVAVAVIAALIAFVALAASEVAREARARYWGVFLAYLLEAASIFLAVHLSDWRPGAIGVGLLLAWFVYLHAEEKHLLRDIA